MDSRLVEIFEKNSFGDPNALKEDYYIPAPNEQELLPDPDGAHEAPHDYFDNALDFDDGLDNELEYGSDEEEDIFAENGRHPETIVDEGQLLLMVRGLQKVYRQGRNDLAILNNVDLRLYSGEICALIGPSGSGKSTLLHILGLLDSPTSGQIIMGEQDVSKLSERIRTRLRSQHIGFVYQFHHLLPEFTALENVALPQIIAGVPVPKAHEKAADLLAQLGLSNRLHHRPATMSGGEQQRVAIARALINDPYLLFADEPTGNLDPETSAEVFALLIDVVRKRGIGALIATHNLDLAHEMDRILEVKSGHILPY
jgi:lipoprotein-releasing system ATP-binding protein